MVDINILSALNVKDEIISMGEVAKHIWIIQGKALIFDIEDDAKVCFKLAVVYV